MQEWLTVIIVLLIVAVVLDGLRRMRQSRRSAIRMSPKVKHQSPAAIDDVKDYGSELPSGGARVVNVRKAKDAVERNVQIRQSAEHKRRNQLKSFRIPEQVSLNLDRQVPTLMESVAETSRDQGRSQRGNKNHRSERNDSQADEIADFRDNDRIEPVFSSTPDEDYDSHHHDHDRAHDRDQYQEEDHYQATDDAWDQAAFSDGREEIVTRPRVATPEVELESEEEIEALEEPETYQREPAPKHKSAPVRADDVADEEDYHDPELVLVINVMAPKGQQFPGAELLEIILNQGLRFGAMNIFHRHEQDDGEGEILYSMANIVVPGTFELAKMKTFSTPGVSFFLTLPMEANSIDAFEDMLTTAKIIGARLHGELKDETRSVLTPQIITHYRSRLQEFVRKQLSKAPA
jgi:cell division protein ZipA